MAVNPVDLRMAFHLVPEAWYRALPDTAPYLPETYEQDGFIHLTHGTDEVLAVGNRYYRADARPYLLLTIDLDLVTSELRYEDEANQFPHIYGPLDRAAIVAVREVERSVDGTFLPFPE